VPTLNEKKIYRIIDVNFNRTKEGLRVCEDLCRFFLNDKKKTQRYKAARHRLTDMVEVLSIKSLILSRDVERDVGKESFWNELKRRDAGDIFYANSQRVKESLRVLEELAKLKSARLASGLKKIRYQIYELEKKIIEKF
jgi:thiamine-phosphate pyrophosphorylase